MVSRSDIAKATQKLAEVQHNPSQDHPDAANRVIDYLYNIRYLALEYGINQVGPVFVVASDAFFGDNIPDRASSEGEIFKLFGGVVDYFAKKQRLLLLRVRNLNYSLYLIFRHGLHGGKEFSPKNFRQRIFANIDLDIEQDSIAWCDNMQTVRLMLKETPKLVTKFKHIDTYQHWLRQECQNGTIKLEWIETSKMPADGLTKCLPKQKHQIFLRQLNMVDIETKIIAS
ncbi:hypothetical protein K3495_g4628 [Podosphaera aphanis]|nr:hypothetical protein K3495_g4628 [Podosphaera aphanis]